MEHWLTIGLTLFFASVLQGIVGFAFTLVAVPLLLLTGINFVEVVVIAATASAFQKITAMFHLHNHVDWRSLRILIIPGLIGLLMGVFVLKLVADFDPKTLRQIVGVLTVILLLIIWLFKIEPSDNLPKVWGHIAAFFSGILTGFANIGGPPMVLWILANRWKSGQMRSTVIAFTLIFMPIQILILYVVFGDIVSSTALKTLFFVPLGLMGGWVGIILGNRLSTVNIRRLMYLALIIISLFSIFKP